jgi:hypothetical protein
MRLFILYRSKLDIYNLLKGLNFSVLQQVDTVLPNCRLFLPTYISCHLDFSYLETDEFSFKIFYQFRCSFLLLIYSRTYVSTVIS